jgi:integrase
MRLGELLGLRWEDADLEAGRIHVQHILHFGKTGVWELSTPKTAKSRRRIELPPTALEALRQYRARQIEERLALGAAMYVTQPWLK